jgi:hypothetical protein
MPSGTACYRGGSWNHDCPHRAWPSMTPPEEPGILFLLGELQCYLTVRAGFAGHIL